MPAPQPGDFEEVFRYHFEDIKACSGVVTDFPSPEALLKIREGFFQTSSGAFVNKRIGAGSIEPQLLSLGAGTLVMSGNKFGPHVQVGENCFIGINNEIRSGTVLEDGVKVENHNLLDIGTRLRKNVRVGTQNKFMHLIDGVDIDATVESRCVFLAGIRQPHDTPVRDGSIIVPNQESRPIIMVNAEGVPFPEECMGLMNATRFLRRIASLAVDGKLRLPGAELITPNATERPIRR